MHVGQLAHGFRSSRLGILQPFLELGIQLGLLTRDCTRSASLTPTLRTHHWKDVWLLGVRARS